MGALVPVAPVVQAPRPRVGYLGTSIDGGDSDTLGPEGGTPIPEPISPGDRTGEAECPECGGQGDDLPAGACGACEFCPSPRKCTHCNGTGLVAASDDGEADRTCRRCSECVGMEHHWIEDIDEDDDDDHAFACKHCPAVAFMCNGCDEPLGAPGECENCKHLTDAEVS